MILNPFTFDRPLNSEGDNLIPDTVSPTACYFRTRDDRAVASGVSTTDLLLLSHASLILQATLPNYPATNISIISQASCHFLLTPVLSIETESNKPLLPLRNHHLSIQFTFLYLHRFLSLEDMTDTLYQPLSFFCSHILE